MQKAILDAQLRREQECRIVAIAEQQILLCDRSAIDPVVYAILTAKNEDEAREKRSALVDLPDFQRALPLYRRALFVLLNPVPEWLVDDGIRSLDNQVDCLKVFKQVLSELEISYSEIGPETKDLDDRVTIILRHLT